MSAGFEAAQTAPTDIFRMIAEDPAMAALVFSELQREPNPSSPEQRHIFFRAGFVDAAAADQAPELSEALTPEDRVFVDGRIRHFEEVLALGTLLVEKGTVFLDLEFPPEVYEIADEYLDSDNSPERKRAAILLAQAFYTQRMQRQQERDVTKEAEAALPVAV